MTQQHRTELLHRYLNDETDDDTDSAAPLHARTAACLLLLYAQPLSLILRLTHDDLVDIDCECHLRFGDPPSPVPPPIATLLDRLVADNRRRGHSGPWLFPGRLPGQPIAYRTCSRPSADSVSRSPMPVSPRFANSSRRPPHRSSPKRWASTTTTRQVRNVAATWNRYTAIPR